MRIMQQTPNPSGAYPSIQEGSFRSVPPGMALWPEELPTDEFYANSGFVQLTVEEVEGVPTVTGYEPDTAAYEAWQASQPEQPPEPEPELTDMDRMAAAYREGVNQA